MSYFSSYPLYIGIAAVTVVISLAACCARSKYTHREIMPYPMQVVVVAHHNQDQLQHPQMCWTVPVEQPPPSYNTVVTAMENNHNIVYPNNES